jgi:hypothetical protein
MAREGAARVMSRPQAFDDAAKVIARQTGLLKDMLDSGRQIQKYLAGMDREGLSANLEKQEAALERCFLKGSSKF